MTQGGQEGCRLPAAAGWCWLSLAGVNDDSRNFSPARRARRFREPSEMRSSAEMACSFRLRSPLPRRWPARPEPCAQLPDLRIRLVWEAKWHRKSGQKRLVRPDAIRTLMLI